MSLFCFSEVARLSGWGSEMQRDEQDWLLVQNLHGAGSDLGDMKVQNNGAAAE